MVYRKNILLKLVDRLQDRKKDKASYLRRIFT
jgi:hypothetical protein